MPIETCLKTSSTRRGLCGSEVHVNSKLSLLISISGCKSPCGLTGLLSASETVHMEFHHCRRLCLFRRFRRPRPLFPFEFVTMSAIVLMRGSFEHCLSMCSVSAGIGCRVNSATSFTKCW